MGIPCMVLEPEIVEKIKPISNHLLELCFKLGLKEHECDGLAQLSSKELEQDRNLYALFNNKDTMRHPEIPEGSYCYRGLKPSGEGKIKVIGLCPHWQKTENGARCELLNEEHHKYCPYHLVWDQVKECDINVEKHNYTPNDNKGYKKVKEVCRCGREVEILVKIKEVEL